MARDVWTECMRRTLGGSTPEDEMRIFPQFLAKIRARMAPWGVRLPLYQHPRLGRI